ncbi:glycosyltransferase [Rathayibacter soli]|uniref:glycosyltransferase n=1 Tax=Rathayibacter soli TaxID=3144168 RepID=UPI0027E3C690|nr:hypothetical protein [Glaciibacter superstes]
MGGWLSRRTNALVRRVVRGRADWPRPVRRAFDSIAARDTWLSRLALRASGADVPAAIEIPSKHTRLYIGPANYAGQAFEWARAAERLYPDVAARNAAFVMPGDFGFAADYRVPVATYQASGAWQTAQLASIEQYTHVLIESFTSLLGNHWGGDLFREVSELRSRGLGVAFMCHGTDIRLPSRHRLNNPWSPFGDDERSRALEATAAANEKLIRRLGGPVLVSTPDLLIDAPDAQWCPVVVNANRWAIGRHEPLKRALPRVVHIPSAGPVKGTQLIAAAMEGLDAAGLIEYRLITGVPAAKMPEQYADADIVLDQFRIGCYGVAACEAMAANRIVVGHVTAQVRDEVRGATGLELPIVEANPTNIESVVREIMTAPDAYRNVAAAGEHFVRTLHDGSMSARVLADFMGISR